MVKASTPALEEKLPPHDIGAEEAVLGSCLIDASRVELLADRLAPADYYRERNGRIWAAMLRLRERREPVDLLTLSAELERAGEIDAVGGRAYLAGLSANVVSPYHAKHYAGLVERAATLRRLIGAAGQIAGTAYESADADAALARAEELILGVRKRRVGGRVITPEERAQRAWDRLGSENGDGPPGVPYGYRDLDRLTGGAHPGEFILVAGRPSMGKSTLLANVAGNMRRAGHKVLFASAEMTEAQLMDRDLAAAAGLDLGRITAGNLDDYELARLTSAIGEIASAVPAILEEADMTTAAIRAAAVEMQMRGGLDAVFVDYVQILRSGRRGDENEQLTEISRDLKGLARSLNVPLIAASQLNRECESRDDKRPLLSDLRGSGSLEQDADVVLAVYRDAEYYTAEQWPSIEARRNKALGLHTPPRPYPANVTEVIVRKFRQGARHKVVRLLFHPQQTRFVDYSDREEA